MCRTSVQVSARIKFTYPSRSELAVGMLATVLTLLGVAWMAKLCWWAVELLCLQLELLTAPSWWLAVPSWWLWVLMWLAVAVYTRELVLEALGGLHN